MTDTTSNTNAGNAHARLDARLIAIERWIRREAAASARADDLTWRVAILTLAGFDEHRAVSRHAPFTLDVTPLVLDSEPQSAAALQDRPGMSSWLAGELRGSNNDALLALAAPHLEATLEIRLSQVF